MIKMNLKLQKKLAAKLLKSSPKRVKFDTERLDEIKESITKTDMKGLVKDRAVISKQKKGVSRARVKKNRNPLKKGKSTARTPPKRTWINKVRALRAMLKTLRDKRLVSLSTYHDLYKKVKGGFFRTKRHMRLYIDENKLMQKSQVKKSLKN